MPTGLIARVKGNGGEGMKTESLSAMPGNGCGRRCLSTDLPERQFCIAESHYYGNSTAQDFARAYNWYRKSAEQGFAEAQFSLGIMYEYGRGIDKSDIKAASWYRLAAQQDHAGALNNLGCMLHEGRIAGGDPFRYVSYFRAAAERGLPAAQYNLSVLYLLGRGVGEDPVEAFKWCGLAADQGYVPACYRLSYMLEHGIGSTKDGNLARKWFSIALRMSRPCGLERHGAANEFVLDGSRGTIRPDWKKNFKKKKKVEVRSGTLINEYCPDCLMCCGPQPEEDGAFPMKLLERQMCGREEDVFYMMDKDTAVLDHRGCKALGDKGCVLPRSARPVACNIFPFVVINRRLFLYVPCPLTVLLPEAELQRLAEEVRIWLEVQPEHDIRRISLYGTPCLQTNKYRDLNMPVYGRSV